MYYEDAEFRKVEGFHMTHYLEDFKRLLRDNDIEYRFKKDSVQFSKGSEKLTLDVFVNRQEMFVSLIRNRFIETNDYNFRERK